MKLMQVVKSLFCGLFFIFVFGGCVFEADTPLPNNIKGNDLEKYLGVWFVPDEFIHMKIVKENNGSYSFIMQGITPNEDPKTKNENPIKSWDTEQKPTSFTKIGDYIFVSVQNEDGKYNFAGLKLQSDGSALMKLVGGKLFKDKNDNYLKFSNQTELFKFFEANYSATGFWDEEGDEVYFQKIKSDVAYDTWISAQVNSICKSKYQSRSFQNEQSKLNYEILFRGVKSSKKSAVVKVFSTSGKNAFEFSFTLVEGDTPIYFSENALAKTYAKQKVEEDYRRQNNEKVAAVVGSIILLGILGSVFDADTPSSNSSSGNSNWGSNNEPKEKKETRCGACGGSGEIWVSVPYYNRITEQSGWENKQRTCSGCGGRGSYRD